MSANDPLREADQQHTEALARLSHTVGLVQSGLNASILVNGGALIGLFTLIAPHRDLAAKLWSSGLAFSAALFLTMVAWLCAAASQDRFQITCTYSAWNAELRAAGAAPKWDAARQHRIGTRLMFAAYACIALSFVQFLVGALLALSALAA